VRGFLLAVLVVAAGCPPKRAERPRIPLPEEALPAVLAPLTWTTTGADLAKRFPGKETATTRYTGIDGKRMIAEVVLDAPWPILGPAIVTITRAPDAPASQLRVEGNGGVRAPVPHNPDLVRRFEALRAELEKQYGPPHAVERSGSTAAHGLPRDEREITVSWSRDGFVVFASLERTELDGWVVSLAAVRSGAPL